MSSYDSWKLATPPEYDTLGQDPADGEVECIHGVDLFAPCAKCKPMAATSGEENDNMTITGFEAPLSEFTPIQLVSMRNAIDAELKSRREVLRNELTATEHALNGTRPRKTRSDANKPRVKPARDENGVAV